MIRGASQVTNAAFGGTGVVVSAPWTLPALFSKAAVAGILILAQLAEVYESIVEPATVPNVHIPEDEEEEPGAYQGQEGAPISGPPPD